MSLQKKDSEVVKTFENVQKVPLYAKRCVKILDDLSKNTGDKVYTENAIRLVVTGKWFNEPIYNACLILLQKVIQEKTEQRKKAELLNKQFHQCLQNA